jgi:hypothetical protein
MQQAEKSTIEETLTAEASHKLAVISDEIDDSELMDDIPAGQKLPG